MLQQIFFVLKVFDHVMDWLNEAEANIGGPQEGNCVFQSVGHKADLDSERQV